jgi:hypothetical protein
MEYLVSPVDPGPGRIPRVYKEEGQMAQQSGKKSPARKGSKKQKKQNPTPPKQTPTASK